jgi:hypothetical protein
LLSQNSLSSFFFFSTRDQYIFSFLMLKWVYGGRVDLKPGVPAGASGAGGGASVPQPSRAGAQSAPGVGATAGARGHSAQLPSGLAVRSFQEIANDSFDNGTVTLQKGTAFGGAANDFVDVYSTLGSKLLKIGGPLALAIRYRCGPLVKALSVMPGLYNLELRDVKRGSVVLVFQGSAEEIIAFREHVRTGALAEAIESVIGAELDIATAESGQLEPQRLVIDPPRVAPAGWHWPAAGTALARSPRRCSLSRR